MATAGEATPDFGLRMKRLREERGVSLRRIADATRISVSVLEALERGDISRLPGGIFSRAFVRSYAIEVGLDPEQTVREFLSEFPHDSVTAGSPHASDAGHRSGRRHGGRVVAVVAAVVVAVGALALLVFWFR